MVLVVHGRTRVVKGVDLCGCLLCVCVCLCLSKNVCVRVWCWCCMGGREAVCASVRTDGGERMGRDARLYAGRQACRSHTHTHARTHAHAHTHAHARTHTHTHTHTHLIHTHTHTGGEGDGLGVGGVDLCPHHLLQLPAQTNRLRLKGEREGRSSSE